jgi:hypothetical protein
VTAPRAGGAEHSSRATRRPFSADNAASALVVLLLLGLALRLAIAYVFFPGSGFAADIGTFTSWAGTLASVGPGRFYESAGFADYPPGYLYVLWLIGGLGNLLAPLAGGNASAAITGLIKIPPMLADIAVGYLLYRLVRSWAGPRPAAARLGLVAAGVYVFNPVTWYDSALWGQTDAVGALVLLLAVAALVRGNSEGAAALTIIAALVKPQFGVVMVPVTGSVLLYRHLFRVGSGPHNSILLPERLSAMRAWFEQERGLWRLVSSTAVGLLVLLVLLLPFNLDLIGFLELMAGTAGGYPFLSVNAYNPWALIGADGRAGLADGGGWSPDTVPLLGPLPGVIIGAALLAASFLLVGIRLMWHSDRRSIVIALVVVALAFFVLPTRVHERYMFPIFALLPLLAVVDRRWLWALVVLSVAAFINMHGILTTPLYATPNVANLPLGELFRQPLGVYTSVLLHTVGFAFVVWQLRPRLAREPDPWAAVAAHDGSPAGALQGAPAEEIGWGAAADAGGQGWAGAGVMRRLLDVVPLRRDRSASLLGEPPGRVGRRDLAIMLLIFMAAIGLRGFNLSHPAAMHFDEVYHARTGVEFLQHWRYGMQRSVYEFTHPHLAKYAMAGGVQLLGNNRVVSTTDLGASVRSAALERRWDEDGDARRGDRAYLVTANGVRVIDLANRRTVTSITTFAEVVAVDEGSHTLYLADSGGGLWRLPTAALDTLRTDPAAPARVSPESFGRVALSGRPLELAAAAGRLVILGEGGELVAVDPATGSEGGRTTVAGASAVLGLTGIEGGTLAVAGRDGITILSAATLDVLDTLAVGTVTGMALIEQGVDQPTIYAATDDGIQLIRDVNTDDPSVGQVLTMPGAIRDVFANPAAALVHVLGTTPDGSANTLYVIEPHSNSIFADAALPFAPQTVLMDVQPRRPATDRLDALAISGTGQVATVDVGSNAFAWRFPGVLAGALMAVAMYLLARFLFRRQTVAVLAGLLILVDGMAFANSRIAMNDTYVALFITAAFALFAPLYLGRWRSPVAVSAGLLGVAVLLGLALASKWVGLYAVGGIGLLILLRSALGRALALVAMVGMTALLGYMAISPGPEATQLNFLFLGVMVILTALLAFAMTVRPMPLTRDELRLTVVGPAVVGGALLLAGAAFAVLGTPAGLEGMASPGRLLLAGVAALVLSPIVYFVARFAAGYGWGPLASTIERTAPVEGEAVELGAASSVVTASAGEVLSEPPPPGWLRPGSGLLGLPWLAALGLLLVVPIAIYVLSYAPWVELGNRWMANLPAGHTGQTFLDLQKSMYDYHNNLRATHAASSPWWAWPLDLKPVWFYQRDFAGGTTGVIYNTGNMVLFWLSIPAVAFAAFQAWRRRSLALAVLVIGVASLWLPWARIDRATFQYHVFTALPFAFLCLAYFLAELWHGPSRRTWALARVAGAVAILFPALLWLLRLPLCAVAGVNQANPEAEICQLGLARPLAMSDLQALGLLAAAIGAGVLLLAWWWRHDPPAAVRQARGWFGAIGMTLVGAGLLATLGGAFLPGPRNFELPLGSLLIPLLWLAAPLIFLVLLAVPAYYVLRARDARRFVIGAVVVAALWFVVWYPNISGLPLPTALSQAHLVTLPTLNYSFQFAVNTDPPGAGIDWIGVIALALVVAMLLAAVVYATRNWRATRAQNAALRTAQEPG